MVTNDSLATYCVMGISIVLMLRHAFTVELTTCSEGALGGFTIMDGFFFLFSPFSFFF